MHCPLSPPLRVSLQIINSTGVIMDTSQAGEGKLAHRVTNLLIHELDTFKTGMREMADGLVYLDKCIGPTLLMLVACYESAHKSQVMMCSQVAALYPRPELNAGRSSQQASVLAGWRPTHSFWKLARAVR